MQRPLTQREGRTPQPRTGLPAVQTSILSGEATPPGTKRIWSSTI